MNDREHWKPTRIAIGPDGRVRVPGEPGSVYVGSILMSTLVARWVAGTLPDVARGTVLDVGCGQVPYLALYEPKAERVLCTDWPNSLHGNRFIDFESDLNRRIETDDASADTILATDVIEHLSRPDVFFAEAARVLRPGGHLVVNSPFLYPIHEAPYDFHRYTPYAYEAMAAAAGLEIVRIGSVGGAGLVMADILAKAVVRIPLIGSLLARALQAAALPSGDALPESRLYPLFVAAVMRKPA
jgi:SAM-dependent methyltransferase